MLSEILMTAVSARGRVPRPDREPGLSCSTLFPCPYALYKIQKGEVWEEEGREPDDRVGGKRRFGHRGI